MRYNETQKMDALKLADEIGARKASERLSIAYPTILDWRKKRAEHSSQPEEAPLALPTAGEGISEDLPPEMQVRLLKHQNEQLKTQVARLSRAIHALTPTEV